MRNDTRDLVRRIAALRAERAGLLGHPHHAAWVIEIGTAETVEAVEKMLLALDRPRCGTPRPRPPNSPRPPDARSSRGTGPSTPSGSAATRAVDTAALRPYLELERVLHYGVFRARRPSCTG